MFKEIKQTYDKILPLAYPADSHTAFYIEGRDAFYSIIDVVSADSKIFALLENNELGEEDIVAVYLGQGNNPNVYLIERYNRKQIKSGLTGGSKQVIFLFKEQVITDEVYDNLRTVLIEEEAILPFYQTIVQWDTKDIDKETLLQGGTIKWKLFGIF